MLVEAGGDPAVARPDARAERVGGHVQPPALEVEADRRGHRLAEDPLPIARIRAVQDRGCASSRLSARSRAPWQAADVLCSGGFGDRRDQRDQLAPQRLEENGQVGRVVAPGSYSSRRGS